MDDKKWIERVERHRFLSWMLIIVIHLLGFKVAAVVNSLVYGGQDIDPGSTYWFTFIIFFVGYSLWSSSIAVNVTSKIVASLFRNMFKKLVRNRKLNDNDIKEASEQFISEEYQAKMLSDIRKGTRNFIRSGLSIGLFLGVVHAMFVQPSLGMMSVVIFSSYGMAWGYLWYKLAWYGFIPLPAGEEG